MVELRSLTAVADGRAVATNADGSVVVGSADFGGAPGTGAAIWRFGAEPTVEALVGLLPPEQLDNWVLESATGVSGDGNTVVGYGTYQGVTEGWVAVLGELCED